jgi:hypothetical protein
MASQQRDYILRLIEQLREFLIEVVRLRETGRVDQALTAIIQAQERLLSLPSERFLTASPEELFQLLIRGETPDNAREKSLLQVDLLIEIARVYEQKEQPALATGAWRFTHELIALATAMFPDTADLALARRQDEVSRHLDHAGA